MKLDAFLSETRLLLENKLQETFNDTGSEALSHAIHYSLLDGGKRLRPALVRAAALLTDTSASRWLIPAQSLEMVHVYSLIHDDLPAMDNDDLRRGKLTNHKKFGEATAILAGDALQSEAFRILAEAPELDDVQVRYMVLELAKASGAAGMVAGQMVDLQSENTELGVEELANLHRLKTGALIRGALQLGAHCGQCSSAMKVMLNEFGDAIGLAFQITDDILDVTSSTAVLGKPQGSDLKSNKSTYVRLLGLDGARNQAKAEYQRAISALQKMNQQPHDILWQLADYILERKY